MCTGLGTWFWSFSVQPALNWWWLNICSYFLWNVQYTNCEHAGIRAAFRCNLKAWEQFCTVTEMYAIMIAISKFWHRLGSQLISNQNLSLWDRIAKLHPDAVVLMALSKVWQKLGSQAASDQNLSLWGQIIKPYLDVCHADYSGQGLTESRQLGSTWSKFAMLGQNYIVKYRYS